MAQNRHIVDGLARGYETEVTEFNALKTTLSNPAGIINVQNPLPTDGDSVYVKDIWVDESIAADWTDLDSTGKEIINIPFDNLHSAINNSTSDPIKTLLIHFNRTVSLNQIGIGCAAHPGKNFSNVKVTMLGSGEVEREVYNDSLNNTKYTSKNYQFSPELANALRIEFNTTDEITLTNITIHKTVQTTARIKALKPDGTVTDIDATAGGNLKMALEEFDETFYTNPLPVADFYLNVSKGLIPGHSFVSKFGQNDDVGTGAFEDVWDNGGTYIYPADNTAPITKLIGHNAADTEPIEIQGLDINGNLVIQTKTITGLTAVTLDTPLWRIFRLRNVGTTDLVADVCAINDADTQDYACINNGNNQTLMALYTIPAGKTGYLLKGTGNIVGTNRAYSIDGEVSMRNFGSVFQLKNTFGLSTDGSSYFDHKYPIPLPISEKTDIRNQVISSSSGGKVNVTFDILLVDN